MELSLPADQQIQRTQQSKASTAPEAIHENPSAPPPLPAAEQNVTAQQERSAQEKSAVTGFELLTSGANQVPDTPHLEVPNVDNLGLVDTANGGYMVLNIQVTFTEGTNVEDYKPVRTAVILGSNETRSGSDENPSKSQTKVDGEKRFIYDSPGANVVGVPKASLEGKTFIAVFSAGEFNKKTGKLDPNVFFYGVKIAYGKGGKIDQSTSGAAKISRAEFIKLSGIKNPEKILK